MKKKAKSSWKTGSLFIVGLKGERLLEKEKAFITRYQPAGIILFRRNIRDPKQLRSLVQSVYKLYPKKLPPFISLDQEGGRVERLCDPFTSFPGNRHLGAIYRREGEVDLTRQQAMAMGRELRSIGFNLNFSPVADIATNPKNPIIGSRSFGKSAAQVSKLVTATVEGFRKVGILSCAKHFPGHGESFSDSHKVLPVIKATAATLSRREWKPFRAAILAKVPMIMTAHILYPAIEKRWPATMSEIFMTKYLRQKLGFSGVIVSDDLEMKAVAARYDLGEAALRSFMAGVDLFLVCGPKIERSAKIIQYMERRGREIEVFGERLQESVSRIEALRRGFSHRFASEKVLLPPREGWRRHRTLAKKIEKLGT